jgi:hypothetical protein
MLDENKKIGTVLMCMGLAFISLGIVLLLDTRLIAIGNVMFFSGLLFILGVQATMNLFTRRDRLRGSACIGIGIFMVLFWNSKLGAIIGMGLEIFGCLNLFANFLPTVLAFARQIPYVGRLLSAPGVAQAADFVAGHSKPKYSV